MVILSFLSIFLQFLLNALTQRMLRKTCQVSDKLPKTKANFLKVTFLFAKNIIPLLLQHCRQVNTENSAKKGWSKMPVNRILDSYKCQQRLTNFRFFLYQFYYSIMHSRINGGLLMYLSPVSSNS